MTRHRLDLLSLLPGLVFVAAALVDLTDAWARDWGDWVAPTVLTSSGLVVLLLLALAGRSGDDEPTVAAAGAVLSTGRSTASTTSADEAAAVPDHAAASRLVEGAATEGASTVDADEMTDPDVSAEPDEGSPAGEPR